MTIKCLLLSICILIAGVGYRRSAPSSEHPPDASHRAVLYLKQFMHWITLPLARGACFLEDIGFYSCHAKIRLLRPCALGLHCHLKTCAGRAKFCTVCLPFNLASDSLQVRCDGRLYSQGPYIPTKLSSPRHSTLICKLSVLFMPYTMSSSIWRFILSKNWLLN